MYMAKVANFSCPTCIWCLHLGWLHRNFTKIFGFRKLDPCDVVSVRTGLVVLIEHWFVTETDRRTDRQGHCIYRARHIKSCGKNGKLLKTVQRCFIKWPEITCKIRDQVKFEVVSKIIQSGDFSSQVTNCRYYPRHLLCTFGFGYAVHCWVNGTPTCRNLSSHHPSQTQLCI